MSLSKRHREKSPSFASPHMKSGYVPLPRRTASDHEKPVVRAFMLHTSSNGRIGRKKLRLADDITPGQQPASNSQQEAYVDDTHLSTLSEDIPPTYTKSSSETIMMGTPTNKKGRKKVNTTSSKLKKWLQFRESCLLELIRHHGLGDSFGQPKCASCQLNDGQLRCMDCFPPSTLRCTGCFVEVHRENPLHRAEEWNGTFFVKRQLINFGLCIQLGHGGRPCPSPLVGPSNFLVFHVNGFHRVKVDFCNCRTAVHPHVQLLRMGWFPATFERPKTAFTFALLDLYHKVTLQGKTTLYDFYHAIMQVTDVLQLEKMVYRYHEFHHVFRIWRHLNALLQAGRAHDPAGVEATSPGELVLECPACPLPGKNLPEDWEDAKPEDRFLYTLFFAIDANFKLKQKARGINDIELAPGWGCYVESMRYEEHVKGRIEPEINSCESDHSAIARANMSVPGYSVNGVGLGICSRHSLIRGNSAVDLEKGEKFCNMDYMVLSSLSGVTVPRVVISYDIGCQWSKNLQARISKYSQDMQLADGIHLEIGIPSWHVNGHGAYCRNNYSLNYLPGVGRTCGEDIEICWSQTNSLAPSTREMGPGARRETLNDHWNGWNMRKIVGFRPLFLKRFKDACIMRKKHDEAFQTFSRAFKVETISAWSKMVEDWISDRTNPNPYEEQTNTTLTLQEVRLELAKEDGKAAGVEEYGTVPHKTSITEFLMKGLEIEEQQRMLKIDVAQRKGDISAKQSADLQERRNALYCRIRQWRGIQLAYMPLVTSLLVQHPSSQKDYATDIRTDSLVGETDEDDTQHVGPAEEVPLFLPSSIPVSFHDSMRVVAEKELRLRKAQAEEALADIRCSRRMITGLAHFKKLNVCGAGNKPNTRMRALYTRLQRRVHRDANRYQAAWNAVHQLEPDGGMWHERFRQLDPQKDIRGPGKQFDDPVVMKNSRFEQSWIWSVSCSTDRIENTEEEFDEAMRAEWAKMRARRDRWEEEYRLVVEEMRRTVSYLEWKEMWWNNQAHRQQGVDPVTYQGLVAYAKHQGQLSKRLATSCVEGWAPTLSTAGIKLNYWESYSKEKGSSGLTLTTDKCPADCVDEKEVKSSGEELTDTDDECDSVKDDFDIYEVDD